MAQHRTVMASGIGHRRVADKAIGPVNRNVVLVAKDRDRNDRQAPRRLAQRLAPTDRDCPARVWYPSASLSLVDPTRSSLVSRPWVSRHCRGAETNVESTTCPPVA